MRIRRYGLRPYDSPRPGAATAAGFTLLEIIVVVALLGFLTLMALETYSTWLPRERLRHTARELAQVAARARVTAVQRGVPAVVAADPATGAVLAFADVDGDPAPGSPGYAGYLVFAPDPAIRGRRTDYRVAELDLTGVAFGGPTGGAHGADSLDGLTTVPTAPPGAPAVLAFGPDGTPLAGGAFRLLDRDGGNVLEVTIADVTGRVEIRKYLHAADAPGGVAGFYPRTGAPGGTSWVWY